MVELWWELLGTCLTSASLLKIAQVSPWGTPLPAHALLWALEWRTHGVDGEAEARVASVHAGRSGTADRRVAPGLGRRLLRCRG